MDALGKATDGGGAGFHGHAGDSFEQGCGENQVGPLARLVKQVRADHAQDQFKAGTDQQAYGQHPKSRGGLVRHDPVVGLHHEQRHHQAQQVDHQAGQDGVAVEPARQLQGVTKPGLDPWQQGRAQVFDFVPGPGEQSLAAVARRQFLAADPLLATFGLARQDQCLAIFTPTP
ncbi:hypothetical protein D9M71_254890 [compost metagenome]